MLWPLTQHPNIVCKCDESKNNLNGSKITKSLMISNKALYITTKTAHALIMLNNN